MNSEATTDRPLGRHRARIEQDCLFFYPVGDPTLAEVAELHGEVEQLLARYRWAFMVIDGRRGFRISPEARRWIADWHSRQVHRAGGSVTYGAGLLTRTFMSILVSAINVLQRRNFPIGFVADEAAARAWVVRQRQLQGLQLGAGQ